MSTAMSSGQFPKPSTEANTAEDRVGETIDPGAGRTSVEGSESDLRSDTRSEHDPDRLAHDKKQKGWEEKDSSLSQSLTCKQVTGLDCDFVAKPDDSADWADRGQVSQQLLAQITTHVGKAHPDRVLSQEEIESIRESITS